MLPELINDNCSLSFELTYLVIQSSAGHYAPGFGIGALEELDVEDEDIYASGNWVMFLPILVLLYVLFSV